MNLLRNLFATKETGKGGVRSGRSRSANRMSYCDSSPGTDRVAGTGCCGTNCAGSRTGCTASEPRIRTCLCQTNVGCLDRPDCGGFRPRGTAETGACPGPCQCEVEDSWNRNVPPKPNCEWVSNFTELRRQWSDHARQESCKCCSCRPSRPSTPCRPCLPCPPATSCCSSTSVPCPKRDPCKPPDPCARSCCEGSRLGGGGCCSQPPPGCCPSPSIKSNCCPPPSCPPPCDPGLRPSCPPPGCCPPPCSPPPCQPCAPQPRPILKKRSCCLCAPGGCMCQPMPRNCSCPPPIQIDARADDECTCDCPSSPECACPPSERRFSRTRTRCQNARICCPLPRLPPGPPCCCTECRPCLPPPCDPCSSSRCCSPSPRFKFCRPASPCPPCSPCRPQTPARPCRPSPACSPCRKPSGQSPCRSVARSSSRGSSCCSPCRAPPPGQSSASCCDHNDDLETAGCGCGDDRESEFVDDDTRSPQCRCGPDGKGCADDCDWCCSQNCAAVDPGNGDQRDDEGRVLEPNQPIASAEKLTAVDSQSQVDTPTTAQGQPTPTISAVKAPGTLDHGSRNGRTALPGGTRRPAINTLHSRLAERRLSARRRSGIGGHVPNAAGAAVEPKSD